MPAPPTSIGPRPPFTDWPDGIRFGGGVGTIWFVPDAAICVQVDVARIELGMARSYLDTIGAIVDAERASIDRGGGLRLYQDFRSIRRIEHGARMFIGEAVRNDVDRWRYTSNRMELAPTSVLTRVAVQLIALIATRVGLPAFDLSVDLARELERDGVRRPEAGSAHVARHDAYRRALGAR